MATLGFLSRKDKGLRLKRWYSPICLPTGFQPTLALGRSYVLHTLRSLLRLKSISLTQFKNHLHRSHDFSHRVIAISGPNGVGKTNLLDAIYYLSFARSYFHKTDSLNVSQGFSGFRLTGAYELNDEDANVVVVLRETGKKEISVNSTVYDKLSQHIGKFTAVMVAPDDVSMITGRSEERRRYVDALICQLDPEYLQQLIDYNKVLLQRNSFLKSVAGSRSFDSGLLDVLDEQLIRYGTSLHAKRQTFLSHCIETILQHAMHISAEIDAVMISYDSQLNRNDFATLLQNSRSKDLALQRTSTGIHKDDLEILFDGNPFRSVASQGQRKSLLFAFKVAEFEILKQSKGYPPILLLDDVFEKLDEQRMHNLLQRVCNDNEGQIFITDTHASRIAEHFDKLKVELQMIQLK